MVDLKLNVVGPVEDEIYGLFPLLIKNIRRGNTILRIDQGGTGDEYTLGRKGLEKFFDLRYEFISPSQRFDDKILNAEQHMQKNYILASSLKAILSGNKVEVLKTLKANGENVQVSWNEKTGAWVVCSKNVALVAQTRAQIDQACYKTERFGFATEMAHVWFDKLDSIRKEKGEAGISELKKDLDGRTLVGEYIGSQEHQHLVKYSRVTLIFYAVVENKSMEDCWPCEQAWALFDKWSFDKVAITTLGTFTDYNSLCDNLCRVFKDVAKSEIAEEEEGNVLYFVERPADGSESKVLSLCKLKTLEYRLFRKMREKLRNHYARKVSDQGAEAEKRSIGKFISEARELLKEHELPRPLTYYIQLFKTAFQFCDSDPANIELLNTEYVTFSEKLLQFFTKTNKDETFAKNSNFFYSPILDVQKDIKFGQGQIATYQLKSDVIEEERKVDEKLDAEIESLAGKLNAEIGDETPIPRARVTLKKNLIVVIPFGVPGSGKSFIWKCLKEKIQSLDSKEFTCSSVTSDGIRG